MTRIAYLMPGQGAQAVGMGKSFYDKFYESRELYKQANTVLGYDLTAICFEGPPEELTKTQICQPALFVTSLAAHAAFMRLAPSVTPIGIAGLSLGELTALAAGGAFSFRDGLYLVQARAEAMAECATRHKGAMLAVVGLTKDALKPICEKANVTAANFNAKDQIVLSGEVEGIDQACALVKEAGARRAVKLDVESAFHSPLMQPASDAFKKALEKSKIQTPKYPVYSNVTASAVKDGDEIRMLLAKQIVSPVLWELTMQAFIKSGATHFIEFPPSRVLTGLLRRIDSSVEGIALKEPEDFEKLSDIVEIKLTA